MKVRCKRTGNIYEVDVDPVKSIMINSSLVSAQNRERLYWTNIAMVQEGLFGHNRCSIPQPKDTGALLRDILQDNVDDKYYISEKALARMLRKAYSMPKVNPDKTGSLNTKNNSGQLSMDSGTTLVTPMGHAGELMIYQSDKCPVLKVGGQDDINIAFKYVSKTPCLTVGGNGAGNNSDSELLVFGVLNDNGELRETGDKSTCIDANYFKGVDSHAQRTMIGDFRGDQQNRIYDSDGLVPSLLAEMSSGTHAVLHNSRIRRLTPIECCRLQTVADSYFFNPDGSKIVSESQMYKMLGNGWTVDVVVWILKHWK